MQCTVHCTVLLICMPCGPLTLFSFAPYVDQSLYPTRAQLLIISVKGLVLQGLQVCMAWITSYQSFFFILSFFFIGRVYRQHPCGFSISVFIAVLCKTGSYYCGANWLYCFIVCYIQHLFIEGTTAAAVVDIVNNSTVLGVARDVCTILSTRKRTMLCQENAGCCWCRMRAGCISCDTFCRASKLLLRVR